MRRSEMDGLTLSEAAFLPGATTPKHSHENAYYTLLVRGAYTEVCDGVRRTCAGSSVVYHPPGEVHQDEFLADGGLLFRLEIRRPFVERFADLGPAFHRPLEACGGPLALLCARMYREFYATDLAAPLVLEGLALEVVAETLRRPVDPDHGAPLWIDRVLERVHAEFLDGVRLTTLAEEAGVHPVHLARTFRRRFGCSVGEYVRRLKVEQARERLASGEESLVDVALSSGFATQSHFTTCFRQHTGLTPARYRTLHRKANPEQRR